MAGHDVEVAISDADAGQPLPPILEVVAAAVTGVETLGPDRRPSVIFNSTR